MAAARENAGTDAPAAGGKASSSKAAAVKTTKCARRSSRSRPRTRLVAPAGCPWPLLEPLPTDRSRPADRVVPSGDRGTGSQATRPKNDIPPHLLAHLLRGQALAAAAEDRHDAVESDLHASIDGFRELGYRYWLALAQTDLAAWLRSRGRRGEAARPLDEAIEALQAIGAAQHLPAREPRAARSAPRSPASLRARAGISVVIRRVPGRGWRRRFARKYSRVRLYVPNGPLSAYHPSSTGMLSFDRRSTARLAGAGCRFSRTVG